MADESQMSVDLEGETTDVEVFKKRIVSSPSLADARVAFGDILVDVVRDSSKVWNRILLSVH